ncbi:transcriptional regulator, GntR family [Anaerovirgula multivorans]|uniref:Transcriptional regulator, GntR family n=1 Tax=Anaerovirgula multivorans TaxID=312168 RepID=A0A239DGX9_9FIRM|nr:PLP-dependent aminotransferase family protein [Anaerovirgula multivorans]SNS31161.1 transcriptional regulator, GntR family [Anaerovirgula multivorans]
MPVNSFEHYPMSWKPERNQLTNPLYVSITKLLEQDIAAGILAPHTKLPPQRELADFLDVNLSTITRAFKICELKGLIYATTGKGTFVSPGANMPNVFTNHESAIDFIEMGVIKPFYQTNSIILNTIQSVLNKPCAERLLEYSNPLGTPFQKQAAQKWLARFQLNTSIDNIMIASGAQNALTITLISLFKPGDKIATDTFTHPNFMNLANLMDIQLVSIAGDECGMLPDALDTICKTNNISGIYLMPNFSNPTNITISLARRKELADVITKHKLILIEDDVYAFLQPQKIAPITGMIPENSVYICSTSKSLCAGLRVAFAAFPDCYRSRIISGIYNINLKTSSFNAEVIAELICSGAAEKIVNKKIDLAKERKDVFLRHFSNHEINADNLCFFQWLPLPKHMDGNFFEKLSKVHGVHVFCSDRFAVGNTKRQTYARIALSSPTDIAELEKGLKIIKSLLENKDISTLKYEFIV